MEWRIARIGTSPVIRFAAGELQCYLKRMAPALDVAVIAVEEYDPALGELLWLGSSDAFSGWLPEVEDRALDDAVYVDTEGGRGIITGTNERSVLLAVYRFLREYGCRWTRPGPEGEIVPRIDLAHGRQISVCERASYRHRGVCIEGATSYEHVAGMIDWLPKIGMNGYFMQFMTPYTFFDKWYSHPQNPHMAPQPASIPEVAGMVEALVGEAKARGMMVHSVGHGWTCEPFGIEGTGWDVKDYVVPKESKQFFALVDGKRELWGGIPLNTNLCYSTPEVRKRMTEAVLDYARAHPNTDYVHFWMADGMNNHCECEHCRDIRPSDYYVDLLNDIDARLTEECLATRVVFLLYVDLLWAPERERLHNPDRFVLMFAPITRTYTTPLCGGEAPVAGETTPYIRNKLDMPRSVADNIAYLKDWQGQFRGDSFDYDYHLIWDHYYDPGGYRSAQVLFEDMRDLRLLGLNGMMSCQVQRVFFPTGLAMTAMATALWNRDADFDTVVMGYLGDLFGGHAGEIRDYLETLSRMFDPPYLRMEKPIVSAQSEASYRAIPSYIAGFMPLFEERAAASGTLPERIAWKNLKIHGELCTLFAAALAEKAGGSYEMAEELWGKAAEYANTMEPEIHRAFDVEYFLNVTGRAVSNLEKPAIY